MVRVPIILSGTYTLETQHSLTCLELHVVFLQLQFWNRCRDLFPALFISTATHSNELAAVPVQNLLLGNQHSVKLALSCVYISGEHIGDVYGVILCLQFSDVFLGDVYEIHL